MSMKILGSSFDLHLGGEDLAFPHHEDEIAQSEGAGLQPPGRRFVKYWLHGAHLLVEGKKMSKSLGNFFTLRDLVKKGFSGREIRYLLLKAHYRETFNFTLAGLEEARSALARLDECVTKLQEQSAGVSSSAAAPRLVSDFKDALDQDLNISAAWAVVFDWVREVNRLLAAQKMSPEQAGSELAAWNEIDHVLGLGGRAEQSAPPELLNLLEERQAARKSKDFKRADAIREELKAKGWQIEDTPKGARLKPL
jgi:cysteinyl-tRNA synthetase